MYSPKNATPNTPKLTKGRTSRAVGSGAPAGRSTPRKRVQLPTEEKAAPGPKYVSPTGQPQRLNRPLSYDVFHTPRSTDTTRKRWARRGVQNFMDTVLAPLMGAFILNDLVCGGFSTSNGRFVSFLSSLNSTIQYRSSQEKRVRWNRYGSVKHLAATAHIAGVTVLLKFVPGTLVSLATGAGA